MKKWLVRITLAVAFPFILLWAFFAELIRGIRSAFWYAWADVRIECDSFRDLWKNAPDA